ncbi:PREDICTED: uncharacterized protein LOC105571069, partial [Vollenhovia emeryi]|uniref:uncharacterized protein LOC105571069 n=1 Tax=Vollenhovia emeryi TaxID=411798 RepID=UPI0005F512A6
KTKGLGGKGKLTGKLIEELSVYYGLAIRRNKDSVESMRKEIWATLYHKVSTDSHPQHHFCPTGEDSWCSYEKAKAKTDVANYKHKPAMYTEVFEAIKPIYEELSSDQLLTRCVGGFTQNTNESLNATVWSMAPKSFGSGKKSST